ncbi:MAG: DUF3391 domain-containing protein [Pseudomonadales bacterium]|nr:DUF3391 domain-containing protein [Pseudomonadales bacterium]
MSAYQSKIYISDLAHGMFICQLPIPWKDTPFPMQGFFVRSQEDIDELSKHCEFVFIDTVRSKSVRLPKAGIDNRNNEKPVIQPCVTNIQASLNIKPVKIRSDRYAKTLPSAFSKELKKVKRIHAKIITSIETISEQLAKGDEYAVTSLNKSCLALVESAISNPDSAIWLTQLESQRSDLFQHSINATIWAIVFGRHLGLEPEVLQDITLALLLAKIGLLQKPDTEKSENIAANDHSYDFVERSIALVKNCKQVNQRVINAIRTHLERHDGSGSPTGIKGNRIPLVGKVAGIADYYEALINPLGNQAALSSSDASQLLFTLRDTKFQSDLVEEFIKAIGIYPTGSIVELDSKELGIIVESKPNKRLFPKVLLIADKDREPLSKPKIINMAESNLHKNIARSLPSSSVSINVKDFNFGGFRRFSA